MILLPLLVVLSTFIFLLLVFLICVLLLRRRRGIRLRDGELPVDLSREDLVEGEGGFEGVESRWLETVSETERREYNRAKDYQRSYPPNSLPTDITLSQFLSIQEKGVSAWSFEPDYETISSVLVHARTEITFLPDPESASSVQSNLPLPKLNEVYYWEAKLFDLPEATNVAIGLATKPYPPFRLPGLNRFSVAYHSNGDKSYNWPFTSSTFGQQLKEGDVLGVGYRPRSGTVFFTRNGRKTEDAFVGLNRWNLFPTVGADGPCSIHVNLGQAGFVFIEANVKKWGLAPSVGTLAPPPAYGSERGSILLAAGSAIPVIGASPTSRTPPEAGAASPASGHSRRSSRRRRPKPSSAPVAASPLRTTPLMADQNLPHSPPPPITPIDEEPDETPGAGPSTSPRYISPTDIPFHTPANTTLPSSPPTEPGEELSSSSRSSSRSSTPGADYFNTPRRHQPHSSIGSARELAVQIHPPPESPMTPNPPTPNQRDIGLQALSGSHARNSEIRVPSDTLSPATALRRNEPPPPSYSPLDPFQYAEGVQIDLPAEVIAAALEGGPLPISAIGQSNTRAERHRSRREGRSGR
ncbi:SPRY-domain-containing protein [Punctularia strigosozonata HHB-11173 SS5]|uniref:SPRY-domain-containing protein n=1 Tax=Punctularia strigosozonata (strain HHB-11173) TaxID=741275 RepID=UPI00044166DA|nr:SPRY-domain-containing protein [Punctularia strigosozonata HHB-11173 SS5]EIN13680.1 SPRY-domain-containing protein [Punctularia strigosozonata HHB-11173 SS5]